MAGQDIAHVHQRAHYRLEAVDLRQDRIGKFIDHAAERASPTAHIAPVYPLVLQSNTKVSSGHGVARVIPGAHTSGFPGAITPAAARLWAGTADGLHIRSSARFAKSPNKRGSHDRQSDIADHA
jgi:hypothetical protein